MTYSPEETEQFKALYLELLALGKTERDIDQVESLPGHDVRRHWKDDEAFSVQCHRARARGAEYVLHEAEQKLTYAWERAIEDSASPPLISTACEIMRHARWRASKYNKAEYGDRQVQVQEGGDKPIETRITGELAITGPVAEHCTRILTK